MKIVGARWNASSSIYSTEFSDGIILCTKENNERVSMVSIGQDSYFLEKGKWPTKKNLEKREDMTAEWISRNEKRYKKS